MKDAAAKPAAMKKAAAKPAAMKQAAAMKSSKHVDIEIERQEVQVPQDWTFDGGSCMDFACKANQAWAMDRLRGLGLQDLTPSTPASHAATLRKLEVRTRPNNRLIQVVLDGRVQGQVTECQTRLIGPMYAANLLCFVAGGGFLGTTFLLSRALWSGMRIEICQPKSHPNISVTTFYFARVSGRSVTASIAWMFCSLGRWPAMSHVGRW